MYPELDTLKKLLVGQKYISPDDNKNAEGNSSDTDSYLEYLFREEVLSKQLLGEAIAEYYGTRYVNIDANPPSEKGITKLPFDVATKNRAIVLRATDKAVIIISDQPAAVALSQIKQFFPAKDVRVAYTLPEFIDAALRSYEQPLETRFSEIIQSGSHVAPEIVDEIIKDALYYKSSDIHFEPGPEHVTIRFRTDGVLREAGRLPNEQYENILNRIKVESGMRIDEHFSAQDGSIQRDETDFSVDIRVSLVPTVHGEKVVFRVLSSYIQNYTLADVGLSESQRQLVEDYVHKPFGMVLVVGPTGSGKTTTLYSVLKLLNNASVNITTIEDPVEYKIDNINQIQVRETTGLTFAKGLRSIVRQDPDIILVGEIRDEETAEISVNAALTGHLLLSTFHANDAATAIPRLVELGVEPFLLASTLELVVAQRLVRKICTHCKHSVELPQVLQKLSASDARVAESHVKPGEELYEGKGCTVCNGSGYLGRTALFEFIALTPAMQELLLKSPSTQEIAKLAKTEKNPTMFEDGVYKAKAGITTISEVLRVVKPS